MRIIMKKKQRKRPENKHTQQPPAPGIAEKVLFWEEQERINQALIPRVLRQGELLTNHIQEHDNLPELFHRQLSGALKKQARQFEEERQKSLDQQAELFRQQLSDALKEQSRQFEEERQKNLDQQAELFRQQFSDASEEQSRQFEEQRKSLDQQAELFRQQLSDALEEQSRQFNKQRKSLDQHPRRTLLLLWLAIGVSLTAIIVSLWT